MKNGKKSLFSRLFYNNKFLVVFSILASFVCWLVISLEQNPTRSRTFTDVTVNLSTENSVASDLGLDIVSGGIGEKVNVTVTGPNYIVSSMDAGDFIVSASLSDVLAAGKYELKLTASANSEKTGYTFASITPSTISVSFDYIDTKEFLVTAEAEGATAVEGLVVDSPVVSEGEFKSISIKGPRAELEKINSVVAYALVNRELSATETFDASIKLYDESGNQMDLSDFTLSTNEVKISVPICKKAVLPVTASFHNAPDKFNDAISYSMSNKTVTVLGPEDTINDLKTVTLAPIDVSKLSSKNFSFDVALVLPDGVKTVENIEFVTVKFDASKISERTVTVSEIKFSNLTSGLKASASATIPNVKICGKTATVRNLKNADFYAIIDLNGKVAGEYTVPAKIFCTKSNEVWQVGEYSVIVTVK